MELPTDWKASVALSASVVAFLISLASFWLSARSHAITHRPYIGLSKATAHLHSGPELTLTWEITFKNGGAVPARMQLEQHGILLKSRDGKVLFDHAGGPGYEIFVLPQAEATIRGDMAGQPVLSGLLDGSMTGEVKVRARYRGPATWFGERRYRFDLNQRYDPPPHEGLFTVWEGLD